MSSETVVLRCRSCGSDLSIPVQVYRAGFGGFDTPELPDNQHAIASGYAFESHVPYRTRMGPTKGPLEFVPQYWMTTRDLLPAVRVTRDPRRLNGCCGLDGCDGPNRECACGAAVGTEMSDCYTSFLFIPEPSATIWFSPQGHKGLTAT